MAVCCRVFFLSLLSVFFSTRQRVCLPSAIILPIVFFTALSKELVCWVPDRMHSQTFLHSANLLFPVVERCTPYAYGLLGSSERKEAAATHGWTWVRSWRPGMRAGAVVRCSVLGRWAVLLELVQFLGAGPLFVSWIAAHADLRPRLPQN